MLLGSKLQLQDQLQEATGIDTDVLSTGNFRKVCVARRMSWAARRSTTRIEDQAYSLMGIFDVNMPLIYGEGEKAFLRLQQEILRVSDDDSLFAWGAPDVFLDMHGFLTSSVHHMHGLFADSPEDFDSKHEIQEIQEDRPPLVIYGNGVRLQYPVCMKGPYEFVIIACTLRHRARAYISVPVKSWGGSFYARCGPLVLIFPEDWTKAQTKILVVKQPPFGGETLPLPETFRIIRVPDKTRRRKDDPFILDEVYCLPHASYIPSDHSIAPSSKIRGPQAALFFTPSAMLDKKRQSLQGEFPLHCFAIVLGYSKRSHPWGAFVPILRKSHVDADFHEIIRSSTGMARHCMTRTQLKDRLRRLDMLVFPRANSSFKQLLSVWAQPWRGNVLEHRNLELSVHLKIERINLVDDAIFVCIDFYEVSMGRSTSKPIFRSFEDTADEERSATEGRELYFPDWLTMDQLEWFIDRVPWKSAG
jgi:hypothetical protein